MPPCLANSISDLIKKKTTELQVKFEFFKTHIHQNSVGLFINSSIIKIRYKNLL